MNNADNDEVRKRDEGTHSELSGSAGDVVQARDVHGGVHFHGPMPARLPVPRQLPADVRAFVNRADELDRLDRILAGDPDEPLTVGLCVVTGTAGVDKTSLALRWAHQTRKDFPDGQLYINLRGYDPSAPVTPEYALEHFLRTLGVEPGSIPADLDARSALYRSLLAERRMLILLDNASTARQVRPLLPGTPGCLVLVTSRNHLSGLVVRHGAQRLRLDVLGEAEAMALLRAATRGYRSDAAPEQLLALARLCARLPLALRIAAERAAFRPEMPLDDLIADLRDESGLWDALTADDDEEADAVRTVFAWSYRALPEVAARMFRLLGLHPGPEFSAAAAASLAGMTVGQAHRVLDTLVGAHLIQQTAPDRYEFHDLLRVYANDQVRHHETADDRQATVRRMVTWYLHTADAAKRLISPLEPQVALDPAASGVAPGTFANATDATRWYETERANLAATVRAAADAGLDRITWQLAVVLRGIYMRHNPFDDWITTARIGLDAARRLTDRTAEAELLESLAMAYVQSHQLDQGLHCYQATLAARQTLGDRFGEALAFNGIGLLQLRQHALADAVSSFQAGKAIVTNLALPLWEAILLANLARATIELGNLTDASDHVDNALTTLRDAGDPGIEGDALTLLSIIRREQGKPEEALRFVQQALDIARERGNRIWEGHWLLEFAKVQRALGQPSEALVSCQRAAVLQRQNGDRSREALALDGAGEACRDLGRPEEAAKFHRLAALTHRQLGDRWHLAVALDNLALAQDEAGEPEDAVRHWREARSILVTFPDPKAARLLNRIDHALRLRGKSEAP
jgi:tetratricopeptide (TPR) repeat protein